ncbi:MAG: hypothetical protein OEU54_04510 [Gemmatimonadota bacterium]|nr:hypothetical protein [Gemmatimonadota bacterium]
MTKARFGLSLRRALAELVIVVVGVLIALSADSWMQSRRDRADERDHLVAVRADVVESVRLLDEADADRVFQVHSLSRLLEGSAVSAPTDSVALWVREGLFDIGVYTPRLSALGDLEASGELQLIRSPELRRSLAALRTALEAVKVVESDYTVSQQGMLDPFLTSSVALAGALLASADFRLSARGGLDLSWVAPPSPELANLIAFKLVLGGQARVRRDQLRREFQRVVELVDERLAELGVATTND